MAAAESTTISESADLNDEEMKDQNEENEKTHKEQISDLMNYVLDNRLTLLSGTYECSLREQASRFCSLLTDQPIHPLTHSFLGLLTT